MSISTIDSTAELLERSSKIAPHSPTFRAAPTDTRLTTRARRDMLNVSDRRSGYYVINLKADYTGAATGACGKPARTDASAAGTAR